MYMCRYVIYKCVAHTSPGLFSSDSVSILWCVSLPWCFCQCSGVFASSIIIRVTDIRVIHTCFESRSKQGGERDV